MKVGGKFKVAFRGRGFVRGNRGNVAMIFGLALIPIALSVGAGVDLSRAMITRARMADALDAAGLAIGANPGLSDNAIQPEAQKYFNANYTANKEDYGTPDAVTVERNGQRINLTSTVRMPTTLMYLAGWRTLSVTARSEVAWGQTKLWVSLVLDNTGSMCEPDSNSGPCPNPSAATKIAHLKTATTHLLGILQNASANDGDVKVSIVPFSKDVNVGTSHVSAAWIDWTDWESAPPNGAPASTVGPGSTCPYTNNSHGYRCTSGPGNDAGNASTIPNSGAYKGYICPGVDGGGKNAARKSRFYNGCYDSVPTKTLITTTKSSRPVTVKQSCTQVNSAAPTCSQTSSSNGSTSNNTSTETVSGYTGDSGPDSTTSSSATTSDGTKSCSTRRGTTTCTFTRTIVTTTVTSSVTKTGAAPYNHNWIVNARSTWGGCIMDRNQSDDISNTAPTGSTTNFPAENTSACPPGTVTPLTSDWGNLNAQVSAMTAAGNTNQTVGLAWGWQTLTNSAPYHPGALPLDTSRVIILLTDGENTQNRWSSSASSIDDRTELICENIKDDDIIVYTVRMIDGNASLLRGCATNQSDDYYKSLSNADELQGAFHRIAIAITNLRLSL